MIEAAEEPLSKAQEIAFESTVSLIFPRGNYADDVFNLLYIEFGDTPLKLGFKITDSDKIICSFINTETCDVVSTGELSFNHEKFLRFQNETQPGDFIEFYCLFKDYDFDRSKIYQRSKHWQKNSLLAIKGYVMSEESLFLKTNTVIS